MPDVPAPVSRRERTLLPLGLALLVGAHLAAADAWSRFGRHLWLDEVYTHALVADPDFGHMMRALADGVETHPPALYVLLRGFTTLAGVGDAALRIFSVLCVLVALAGVYLTLRRAYSAFVAGAATAAVWCHPLVLHYGFEARHYALWLAGLAWLAYFLARYRAARAAKEPAVGWGGALAAASVLVCTTHYFGVVSVALVFGGATLVRPAPGSARLAGLVPIAAGVAALTACAPLLVGQRRATTVPTWVAPPSTATLRAFGFGLLPVPYLVLAVLALLVLVAVARRARGGPERAALVGLGCLLLMPALLVAFSYTVQSVLVDRYAVATVLAVAPLTAVLAARLPRPVTVLFLLVLAALSGGDLRRRAAEDRARDGRADELIAAVRDSTDGPVLFERPHELYMICHAAPDLAGRCFLHDFEAGASTPAPARVFMRDLARRYARYYERPGMMSWEAWRGLPRHFFVTKALDDTPGEPPASSGMTPRLLGRGLYELTEPGRQ